MSELAEHINMLCAEQSNFEMSQALSTQSREAFNREPGVHSTGLVKVILHTGPSVYAATFLAEEFSKA